MRCSVPISGVARVTGTLRRALGLVPLRQRPGGRIEAGRPPERATALDRLRDGDGFRIGDSARAARLSGGKDPGATRAAAFLVGLPPPPRTSSFSTAPVAAQLPIEG